VRRVEEIAQMLKNGESVSSNGKEPRTKSKGLPEEYNELRNRLADFFHSRVQMTCSPKGKGKISILFNTEEELEQIMNALDNVKK
jgi:ParB family chromosome partitioning protein